MIQTHYITEQLIEEFDSFIEKKSNRVDLMLTDQDLCSILECSRVTLYRARLEGRLPYDKGFGGEILYCLDSVMLVFRTGKFRVRGLNKLTVIERLETYKKMLQL